MFTLFLLMTPLWAVDCGFRTLPIEKQLAELRDVRSLEFEALVARVQALTDAAPDTLRPHARELKGLAFRLIEPLTRVGTAYATAERFIPFFDRVAEILPEREGAQVKSQKLLVRLQRIRTATGDEKYEGFLIAAREAAELSRNEGVWSEYEASALFDLIYQVVWRLPKFDRVHHHLIVIRLSEVARLTLLHLGCAFADQPRWAQEQFVRHVEELESLPELRRFPGIGKDIQEFWGVTRTP